MPDFVELVVNAVFTGLGTVIGVFLGTRLFVSKLEVLISKLKRNGGGQ